LILLVKGEVEGFLGKEASPPLNSPFRNLQSGERWKVFGKGGFASLGLSVPEPLVRGEGDFLQRGGTPLRYSFILSFLRVRGYLFWNRGPIQMG